MSRRETREKDIEEEYRGMSMSEFVEKDLEQNTDLYDALGGDSDHGGYDDVGADEYGYGYDESTSSK